MTTRRRFTLTQYLIEQRRRFPGASGDFNALLLDVALACKAIARSVAFGELGGVLGNPAADVATAVNVQGEEQKRLDVISNAYFTEMTEWGGHLAGMASEEMDHPYQIPETQQRGKYLLVFDPLDGSSNIDVNVTVGSIFSILRAPQDVIDSPAAMWSKPTSCSRARSNWPPGYALYGPTTMLVLTVGNGVASFTLDPNLGQFMLTHPNLQIPDDTHEFAINASNSRFWEAPVKRYVDECLAGKTGARGKDFNMRWIASMVAEAHRILMRGGVFMYPKDTKDPSKHGRLRLLYEANPVGMLIEQGRWPRQHGPRTGAGHPAHHAAPAHRPGVRLEERSGAHRALPP